MTDIKRIGNAGIHTVEGNLAGARAAQQTKKRELQKAEYETIKNKIKEDHATSTCLAHIDQKFSSATDNLEQEFREKTVGLVTADEFRKARAMINEQSKEEDKKKVIDEEKLMNKIKKEERESKRKKIASTLSFASGDYDEEDEGQDEKNNTIKIIKKKNPTVDTSFLPDRDRDIAMQEERERLKSIWLKQQEEIKNEDMEVVYSYWDGSGHRKSIQIKKGITIGKFLELVKLQLITEFYEIRSTSSEDLMYIKEDLIIPHHYSFYDLIITKARGKSGPLFHFDVHDDVRLVNDATIEKDESHPGKIVERRWYEKNKHIFPASRWEIYDARVVRDDKYTIHG